MTKAVKNEINTRKRNKLLPRKSNKYLWSSIFSTSNCFKTKAIPSGICPTIYPKTINTSTNKCVESLLYFEVIWWKYCICQLKVNKCKKKSVYWNISFILPKKLFWLFSEFGLKWSLFFNFSRISFSSFETLEGIQTLMCTNKSPFP